MSQDELDLVETEALVDALGRRNDCTVVCRIGSNGMLEWDVRGNSVVAIGMLRKVEHLLTSGQEDGQ